MAHLKAFLLRFLSLHPLAIATINVSVVFSLILHAKCSKMSLGHLRNAWHFLTPLGRGNQFLLQHKDALWIFSHAIANIRANSLTSKSNFFL